MDAKFDCGKHDYDCKDPEYNQGYSMSYSQSSGEPIVLVDKFEQEGDLEYLSLKLDGDVSQTLLNFILAVVVIDPIGRFIQVGGYDWQAYFVNSAVQTLPYSWIELESDGYGVQRDVRAAGLSSFPSDTGTDDTAERRTLVDAKKHPVSLLHTLGLFKNVRPADIAAYADKKATMKANNKATAERELMDDGNDDDDAYDDDVIGNGFWQVYLVIGSDIL